ncbi:hypothetical protein [Mycoplasmopsis caviae]|uniref:Uncharacterized protein n=1 Tax=Mycoplasmopsis caviae TaxID=55603 RepID=A0A3P8MFD6_9BACT|nr:hypothetical protein [Mycoplasmopsis caviae]VDR42453.1 Uncharacterised protein [Mycoplasmopsis caviae]
MTRKNKKIIGITAGIASGIVGTISIGTIAGASVDHSNYKKIKQEFDTKIDSFTKFNKKLKQNHDDLVNIIKDEPLEDEVKAQLNMILDSYNKQMQLNKELSDELINIQKSQDKYKVGHHFGNNSFLRAKKNFKQYKLIKERIPEAVTETETILNISQVEHLQKIFDKCEKLATEVYNLRDSDNFLIKSIENKDTKFNELKLAIDNYKKQKENDEFKKEKKLTKDYILSGLKLLSEDYKVWDEGALAKFNENKITNSISKKIISNTEIETIQTSVGLDISKYQQAKKIVNKYFSHDGKIIKHKNYLSRTSVLSDLKSANESINEFNNEMIKYNTI